MHFLGGLLGILVAVTWWEYDGSIAEDLAKWLKRKLTEDEKCD